MGVDRHYEVPVQVKLEYANKEMKAKAPDAFFLEVHQKRAYQASDTYSIRPVYGCTTAEFKREYPTREGTLSYVAHACVYCSENTYDSKLEVSKEEFLINAALQGLNPEIEFVYDEDWNEIDCRIIGGESLRERRKKAFGKDWVEDDGTCSARRRY